MAKHRVFQCRRRSFSRCCFAFLAAAFFTLPSSAHSAPAESSQKITVPAQPYPLSGLRQRLINAGKEIPTVDNSLQFDIPGIYYPPDDTSMPAGAVIIIPDCDDRFPEEWVAPLHKAGLAVLRISPGQAHPSQSYCTAGTLDNPKHGVTYWAFDALSALAYLAHYPGIDPERIAIFGYGYGAAAAQFAIYRHGHAKRFKERFRTMVGLRAQCMSEMDNFSPALLVTLENDPINPPAWCQWRMDRDLRPDRAPVKFEMLQTGETLEKQATRSFLKIETTADTVALILNFLRENGMSTKDNKP